ncbi:MAG: hypothetical protein IJQ07_03215 [Clostridia bacterium]|nr:hypothetical protein [Clostridia bacterium]
MNNNFIPNAWKKLNIDLQDYSIQAVKMVVIEGVAITFRLYDCGEKGN